MLGLYIYHTDCMIKLDYCSERLGEDSYYEYVFEKDPLFVIARSSGF